MRWRVTESGINIRQIAIDRLYQGDQLGQELYNQDGFEVVAFGQGFVSFGPPMRHFEELLLSGLIRHGGNPVLRWHASNVSIEFDAAGNMKPSKKKSTERIDGIVSSVMAVGMAFQNRTNFGSIYNTQDLFVI